MTYIALVLGCLLLYKGGDWLLAGMLDLGVRLNLPAAITGLVLVSLGTSAPELFVSVASAVQGHGALAAGNVMGSNIINVAIVLGLAASVAVLPIDPILRPQLGLLLAISVAAVFMLSDGQLLRSEGIVLILAMIVSFLWAFRQTSSGKYATIGSNAVPERSLQLSVLLAIAGLIALILGAEALIWGGLKLADQFGLSESIVALTVTALGTSLPEIAATLVAVVRRETSLAVGNVVGSNILNLGLVLGFSSLLSPLRQINLDSITLAYFTLLALLVTCLAFKPGSYPRWFGFVLLASYAAYVASLLMQ